MVEDESAIGEELLEIRGCALGTLGTLIETTLVSEQI